MKIEFLNSQIQKCRLCDSIDENRKRVCGVGKENSKIFLIGLAPGRLGADKTGIPFTRDRSGKLLRHLISKTGLSENYFYITNLVKCNPRDKQGNNRTPTKKEIENCKSYLEAELSLIKPKIIVTLGVLVSKEILGKNSFSSMEEVLARPIKHEGRFIFPLYHPAFVIRGQQRYTEENYLNDFFKLCQLIEKLDDFYIK
jgi:DNA polymerase